MSNINCIIESALKFDCNKMKNCKDLKYIEKALAKSGVAINKAHDRRKNEHYWEIKDSDKVKNV